MGTGYRRSVHNHLKMLLVHESYLVVTTVILIVMRKSGDKCNVSTAPHIKSSQQSEN